MRRRAACTWLLLLCACAAQDLAGGPDREPPIVGARVTFRSHLAAVRECESRGAAPSVRAAVRDGVNLALVFAPPVIESPDNANVQPPGGEAAWVPVEATPGCIAGVRLFNCPAAFIEKVAAEMKRPRDAKP